MTDYFVRLTGSDAADGLTAGNAWETLVKALDTVGAGDTVYIGPGLHVHREGARSAVGGTTGSPIIFMGDVQGEKTGDPAGPVALTSSLDPWSRSEWNCLLEWGADSKFFEWHNVIFLSSLNTNASYGVVQIGEAVGAFGMDEIVFADCMFLKMNNQERQDDPLLKLNFGDGDTPVSTGARIQRCYFEGSLDLASDDNVTASFDVDVLIESCVFTERSGIVHAGGSGVYNFHGVVIRNCSALMGYHQSWFVNCSYPYVSPTLTMHGLIIENGGIIGSTTGLADSLETNYCLPVDDVGNPVDEVEGVRITATPYNDDISRGVITGYEANRIYDKYFGIRPFLMWEPLDIFGYKNVCIGGGDPDEVPALDYYGRPFDGNRGNSYVCAGWYNGDFATAPWSDVYYTWQDPDSAWADEAEINESRSFQEAITSTNGSISTNFLHIEKPAVHISDAQTIQNVWIRFAGMLDGVGNTINFNFYTLDEGEDLGGFSIVRTVQEDRWYDLEMIPTAPAGGWTPTHVRNLECRIWQTGNGDIQVQRILIYLDTGDHDAGAVASRGQLDVETTTVNDGVQALKISRAGFYQTTVPVVASTEITISVDARKDSNYSGANEPQLQVYNIPGGTAEQTDTLSVAANTWESLTATFTPSQSGYCTVRCVSRDASADGETFFDNLNWS